MKETVLPAVSLADMLEPSAWLAKVPVIRLEAWMLSMMVKVLPTARPAATLDKERTEPPRLMAEAVFKLEAVVAVNTAAL